MLHVQRRDLSHHRIQLARLDVRDVHVHRACELRQALFADGTRWASAISAPKNLSAS